MTRYYYTCQIKALYMMKEFGVEFEVQNEDFDDKDDGFTEPYFDFRLWEIESPETINTLLDVLDSNGRIYVQSLSKSIFEPEEGDLINYKSRSGKNKITATYLESFIDDDNQPKWKLQSQGMNSPKIYRIDQRPCEIIIRANKQFFMPGVEND